MSPKNCSLAFDEIKQDSDQPFGYSSFEPTLNLLVNEAYHSLVTASAEAEMVKGKITVSF